MRIFQTMILSSLLSSLLSSCFFCVACSADAVRDSGKSSVKNSVHDSAKDPAKSSILDRILAEQSTLKTAVGALNYDIRYAEESKRKTDSYAVQLTVQVPNKYRFALQTDDQKEMFISDGLVEWHVEILDEDRFASPTHLKDGHGKFSHITKFLPLDRKRLAKQFKLSAHLLKDDVGYAEEKKKHPQAHSVMVLAPLTADQKDHMQWTHIYFNEKHHATAIQILDANENLYDIHIPEMKYNVEVSADRFTYEDN